MPSGQFTDNADWQYAKEALLSATRLFIFPRYQAAPGCGGWATFPSEPAMTARSFNQNKTVMVHSMINDSYNYSWSPTLHFCPHQYCPNENTAFLSEKILTCGKVSSTLPQYLFHLPLLYFNIVITFSGSLPQSQSPSLIHSPQNNQIVLSYFLKTLNLKKNGTECKRAVKTSGMRQQNYLCTNKQYPSRKGAIDCKGTQRKGHWKAQK